MQLFWAQHLRVCVCIHFVIIAFLLFVVLFHHKNHIRQTAILFVVEGEVYLA